MKYTANNLAVITILMASLLPAQDRRITPIAIARKQALVIGNSAYQRAPIKNPVNDAAAMEATLRKLGFEVHTLRDLDLPRMEAAIDEFTAGLAAGSLAFFYFSGHGVQVNFTNYLLPVDFAAASETDVKYKAYAATRIQEKMEASGARLRILALDACRNNPFSFKRDAVGGLAAMPVNAEGTLIAFSTGDNNTADDNQGESNGLYTKYLLPALLTPGLQLREAFQKAKEEVYTASRRTQNPSIYENIVGAYYLVSAPSGSASAVTVDAAAETWALIRDSRNAEDFDEFARSYPNSDLVPGARIRATQLRRAGSAAPVASATPPSIPTTQPSAEATKVNLKDGLTYVWIPPGRFNMGCSPGDRECERDEKPAHEVAITGGFWMGETEVTQAAWKRVMGTSPSRFQGENRPVERITWEEAMNYCQAIGERLPAEAEWEYAARAGSKDARYGSLNSIAWYSGNSRGETNDVKGKSPNAWGLYDMLGNVWEWVDALSPKEPSYHIVAVRGGSWSNVPKNLRVSHRGRYGLRNNSSDVGFRCVGN